MWLQGSGPFETRPDYTGGVLVSEDDPEVPLGPALVIYSDPNGKDPERSKWIRRKVDRVVNNIHGAVFFIRGNKRKLVAHPTNPHAILAVKLAEEADDR
jgi:hypothetical protein